MKNDWTIRLMTPADYSAVSALWSCTPGIGMNDIDDSRMGIERYLDRNPNTCFVAETNSDLVGAILCGHDGRRAFIYHLAVHPDYRHQGIGSSLVSTAIAAIEKEKIHKIALVAFENNEAGNAFWEKQGFIKRNDLIYRNRAL